MVDILDMCSGKWEGEEMGGDREWEVVCTGWNPKTSAQGWEQSRLACHAEQQSVGAMMPADLLSRDLDEFLERMVNSG